MIERLRFLFRHIVYNLRGGFLVRPVTIALVLACSGAVVSWIEESEPSIGDWVPRVLFFSHSDPGVVPFSTFLPSCKINNLCTINTRRGFESHPLRHSAAEHSVRGDCGVPHTSGCAASTEEDAEKMSNCHSEGALPLAICWFLSDVPQTADPSLRPAPAHAALPLSGQAGTAEARPSQTQGRRDFARDDSAHFYRIL